jgi:hypothetical protein
MGLSIYIGKKNKKGWKGATVGYAQELGEQVIGGGEVNKEKKNKIPKNDQTQKDYKQQHKEMKTKSNK